MPNAREGLPPSPWEIVDHAGRLLPFEVLARVYAILEAAGVQAALYRARGARLELDRATSPHAPALVEASAALLRALSRAERSLALDELDDASTEAASFRGAAFDRLLPAWEDGDLHGLLAVAGAGDENGGGPLAVAALALYARRLRRERDEAERVAQALRAGAELASASRFEELAFLAVHKLSAALDHDLAALVSWRHGRARLIAVSGRETFDRSEPGVARLEAVAAAGAALGRPVYVVPDAEADTGRVLGGDDFLVPGSDASAEVEAVVRAARAELQATERTSLTVLPLQAAGELRALLVAEAKGLLIPSRAARERLLSFRGGVESALGRLLEVRDIPFVFLLAPLRPLARTLGRVRHGRAAALVVSLAVVAGLGAVWPRDLVVRGRGLTVPGWRAAVRAPRDGILAVVSARDGTRVARGEVLATLAAEPPLPEAAVVSPMDGQLAAGDLLNRLGEEVRAGQRLATVDAPESPLVEVPVDELDLAILAPGARAEVSLPGLAPLGARFVETRSIGGPNAARFVAVLEIEGENPARPGISGWARIHCGRRALWAVLFRRLAARLALRFGP